MPVDVTSLQICSLQGVPYVVATEITVTGLAAFCSLGKMPVFTEPPGQGASRGATSSSDEPELGLLGHFSSL